MNDQVPVPTAIADVLADPGAFRAARLEFLRIRFQEGHVRDVGVNGCFVEDLIDAAIDRIRFYQSGGLACAENEATLAFLVAARGAMDRRRANRLAQGVAHSYDRHVGTPTNELIAELDPHHHEFADEADVRPIYR
jgi:hypothetical protein